MFGIEHIYEATKWLQAAPDREIIISHKVVFRVELLGASSGSGVTLMDALKSALQGLPKQ